MSEFSKVINSLINLLALSGGRDKACRLIQYFCKYLVTKYQEQYELVIHQRDIIGQKKVKSQSLMGAMGMTRKVLRFGPSINTIKVALTNLQIIASGKCKEPLHIFILKTMSAIFLGMFFICDHYLWLFQLGLVSNEFLKTKFAYLSALGWLLGCLSDITKNFFLFQEDPKPAIANTPLIVDSLRVLCDIPIAYSFVKPGSVNGKVVGILGTITSALGIYQMWK